MPDDIPPSMFELLRTDFRDMRKDFNDRLDKLVSSDAFAAEQKRRDEQYVELGKDIAAERAATMADVVAERAARVEAIQMERSAREAAVRHERAERERSHAETDQRSHRAWDTGRWTLVVVLTAAGVVAAYLAVWWRP